MLLLPLSFVPAFAKSSVGSQGDVVSTREMERINWMEFREVVPSKINTVLLPTGTLEPHGVANNGADITAPVAICRQIAKRLNAMIAPVLPYGITGSMDAYPGAFQITESAYRPFIKQVMEGLAKNGYKKTSSSSTGTAGQGYPKFDQKKADEYFAKVNDKIANLVSEVIRKWDLAGL